MVAARLRAELATLPRCRRLIVAFSGGVDSVVLLDCLARDRPLAPLEILVCHVDHGLQARSGEWAAWCAARCAGYGIAFASERLPPRRDGGESREAWARRLRYAVLDRLAGPDDLVLTAHQREDQAETLLLAALRGGGPHGLGGIAPARPLGAGRLVRPLLEVTRADIVAYALARGLPWLEDPSNADPRFDRNFLRRQVLPLLRTRWPAADETLARAADLQREAAEGLDALADRELAAALRAPDCLDLDVLRGLDAPLRRLLLRRFVARAGGPLPSREHLAQIERGLVAAGPAAAGPVVWGGIAMRRYRNRLHLGTVQTAPAADARWPWRPGADLELPHGRLVARPGRGIGIALARLADRELGFRLRRGGERCRPAGRAHGQTLKRLLQEYGVPPWRRPGLPLLYADEDLVAVAGVFVCDGWTAHGEEAGVELRWAPQA